MSKYTELKGELLGELEAAKAVYKAAKADSEKLEALQGVANMITLLQQTETLINAELINVSLAKENAE